MSLHPTQAPRRSRETSRSVEGAPQGDGVPMNLLSSSPSPGAVRDPAVQPSHSSQSPRSSEATSLHVEGKPQGESISTDAMSSPVSPGADLDPAGRASRPPLSAVQDPAVQISATRHGSTGNPADIGGATRFRNPLPRTRFGVRVGERDASRIGATASGYRDKYAADLPCRELDPDSRVWLVYNDESAGLDREMISELDGSLDILLVFAGLFSGVVATFAAQSSQALSENKTDITNSLLGELIALERAQANRTPLDSIAPADVSFTPNQTDVMVNVLWFTSLALSLVTAFLAMVTKEWLRQYSSSISGCARTRALTRQFRYTSFQKWGVHVIIAFLPLILSASFLSFMLGLQWFLFPLSPLIGQIITGIIVFFWLVLLFPLFAFSGPGGRLLASRERAYVESTKQLRTGTSTALSWLDRSTWDTSARIVLLEALGVEDAPLLDVDLLLPVLRQQWAATAPHLIAAESGNLADDIALGRLIRASVSLAVIRHIRGARPDSPSLESISLMLKHLPKDPIGVADGSTILSVAACGRTSRFTWEDQEEVELAPRDTFQFVLDHCSPALDHYSLAHLAVPKWMWWSILIQSAVEDPRPVQYGSADEAQRLFKICIAGSENIQHYQLSLWIGQLDFPAHLRHTITECDPYTTVPPFSSLTLAAFLRCHFTSIFYPTA
ncbi:hypothetical protein C8J57DRAFT_1245717 [Mycena rebaudengoi]|nr:hypothetical protein C8J57DRAFT_1245717 [Mycena rebaudengoi]